MARPATMDPLDRFRWIVTTTDFSRLGFTSCQVPSVKVNTRTYPEGGAHLNPRQIVDTINYTPVILTRGVTNDTSFNQWATGVFDWQQEGAQFNLGSTITEGRNFSSNVVDGGTVSIPSYSFSITIDDILSGNVFGAKNYRKDITIKHVNRVGQVEVVYKLYGAFPIEYKPASDFNASDDLGLSIESITLIYEGFDVKYNLTSSIANIAASSI